MFRFNIDKPYQHLIIILFIAVLLMVILSIVYWSLDEQIRTVCGNYMQLVTVFTMLMSVIFTFFTLKYQLEDRQRSSSAQYVNLTQNSVNDIDKMFMNNPLLDRLYFEMYAEIPHIEQIKELRNNITVTSESLKQEHHMASIIFQKIADIYFSENLDKSPLEDSIEWISTFKMWMRSPILQSHWKYLKHEHHPFVQHFIDSLIVN